MHKKTAYHYSYFEIFICIYSVKGETKYQQIHPDTALAAQQIFTSLFTYLLEPL